MTTLPRHILVTIGTIAVLTAPVGARGVSPDQRDADALGRLRGKIVGRIVWESNRTDSWQLYTMNADGTGARQLTSTPGDSNLAHLSADGRQILFTYSVPGKSPQAWLMGTDGSGARMLLENAEGAEWRKGCRAIQFMRQPLPDKDEREAWEYDLATGQEHKLFPPPGVQYEPAVWGGLANDDGTRFVIWSPKPRGTWVLSADGAVQKHVHPGCEGQVAADQRYGYGVYQASRFVRFNLTDGEDLSDILVLSGPWSHTYMPRVTNDAHWLIFGACPPDQHDDNVSDYELFIVPLVDWKASGKPVRLSFNTRTDRWPDLWVAPEGETNPLPDGPYDVAANRATNPPPPPQMLFSFANEDAKPEFGGDWGLWPQQDGCQGTATFVAEDAEGGQGGAMKVDYTLGAEPYSFSLWLTSGNNPVDLSAYDRLALYARGDVSSLTLVVKDSSATDPNAPQGVAETVIRGLTGQWQRFEVPFAVFKPREGGGAINWRAVNHVGIAMISPQNAHSGTFWVDNLRAETGPED